VFYLAAFIFSPIFGRYGTKFGLKFLYNAGAFIQAFAGIGFGFLDYIQDAKMFLGISYLLRYFNFYSRDCFGLMVEVIA